MCDFNVSVLLFHETLIHILILIYYVSVIISWNIGMYLSCISHKIFSVNMLRFADCAILFSLYSIIEYAIRRL